MEGWKVQTHAFLTSKLLGGRGQLHTPTALGPGKTPVILTEPEDGMGLPSF